MGRNCDKIVYIDGTKAQTFTVGAFDVRKIFCNWKCVRL